MKIAKWLPIIFFVCWFFTFNCLLDTILFNRPYWQAKYKSILEKQEKNEKTIQSYLNRVCEIENSLKIYDSKLTDFKKDFENHAHRYYDGKIK